MIIFVIAECLLISSERDSMTYSRKGLISLQSHGEISITAVAISFLLQEP
jgi:hypothetical protein